MMNLTLIPVRIGATIPPIDVLQLPDGRLGATLRSLCRILDIDFSSQLARVRRHPKLSQALVLVPMPFGSTTIEMHVLLHWAIPIWAAGLQVSRLPEAKQPVSLALQQKAVDLIERAFAERAANANVPPPPSQASAPQSVWQEGHAFLHHLESEFEVLRRQPHADQQEVGARLAAVEETQQHLEERVTTLEGGPARPIVAYSGQRLKQIYLLARQLRASQGLPIGETLAGLADHFEVEDVSDLPESAWPAVLDWFDSLQ
ncbi:MAG TPA: hypothetical protein VH599_10085 [Ktedonobacterales bacterium]|jgi:hypothetical protein